MSDIEEELGTIQEIRREVEDLEQGCVLTDEISFSTRMAFPGPVMKPVYHFVFNHRHKRLIQKFGTASIPRS
jgi:hypothetical protein